MGNQVVEDVFAADGHDGRISILFGPHRRRIGDRLQCLCGRLCVGCCDQHAGNGFAHGLHHGQTGPGPGKEKPPGFTLGKLSVGAGRLVVQVKLRGGFQVEDVVREVFLPVGDTQVEVPVGIGREAVVQREALDLLSGQYRSERGRRIVRAEDALGAQGGAVGAQFDRRPRGKFAQQVGFDPQE